MKEECFTRVHARLSLIYRRCLCEPMRSVYIPILFDTCTKMCTHTYTYALKRYNVWILIIFVSKEKRYLSPSPCLRYSFWWHSARISLKTTWSTNDKPTRCKWRKTLAIYEKHRRVKEKRKRERERNALCRIFWEKLKIVLAIFSKILSK